MVKERTEQRKQQLLLVDVPDVLTGPLAECFAKENWRVCALGTGATLAGIERFDNDLMTEEAEDVFALKDADVLAASLDGKDPSAIARLERLLSLAKRQRHLQHIFLFSSADVFSGKIPASEQSSLAPATDAGRQHARLEALACAWKQGEQLPVTIVRMPELFGEGRTAKDGFFGAFLAASIDGTDGMATSTDGRDIAVRVDGAQEFLAARDAAYGIWRAVERDFAGDVLHLGSGQGFGFDSFVTEVRKLLPAGTKLPVRAEGRAAEARLSFGHPFLDSAFAYGELGWQPRCDIREGLRTSVQSFLDRRDAEERATVSETQRMRRKQLWRHAVPYLENVVGAVLMAGVAAFQQGTPVNHALGVDFNYLYIGTVGLLYGKRQAMLSVAAALVILITCLLLRGAEVVSLLYNPIELLHFISYLFVGVLTGYFADRASYERAATVWKERKAQERQSFLKNVYQQSVRVKDRLYRQIVNADDSIGRVYHIVRRLDSVEEENLFTQTAAVTAEVLGVTDVAVYTVSSGGYYLRQKVRMGALAAARPHSLHVEDHPYLLDIFRTQRVFANRALKDDVPDLAAPVIYEGNVIAVIEIYGLDFTQWSYYEQNLLSLTSRLVAASLGRAYRFEQEAAEKRYLPGTRILKGAEFQKVLDELVERRRLTKDNPATLLPVAMQGMTVPELDKKLSSCIRAEDFAGEYEGGIALLLPNVADNTLGLVRQRLANAGVATDEGRAVV